MRVLVTGASGHVGGAVAAGLAASGNDVVGLSRRMSAPAGVRALAADLGNDSVIASVVDRVPPCEAIVHAAASLAKEPLAESVTIVNGLGTQRVMAMAAAWAVRSVVVISGVPVIGVPLVRPVTEEHPTAPATAYHASKLYSEHVARVAAPPGCAVAVLRVTSPIGPGTPDGRITSVFVRKALADEPITLAGQGLRRQDYIDVRDVADAVERAIVRRADGCFNVASGVAVANTDLAETCIAVLGSTSRVEFSGSPDPDEGVSWDVSVERAARDLGFRAEIGLDTSLLAMAAELAPTRR
jgi:nucleoside-diphosphate-sugar epimerase